jgi:hypothetical protein
MKIKKKIEPDKFLPQHESDPDLRSAPGDKYARFFFSLNRQRCCLTFNEDECLRLAYLFEQAAHRLADRAVEQSDEGYTIKYPHILPFTKETIDKLEEEEGCSFNELTFDYIQFLVKYKNVFGLV